MNWAQFVQAAKKSPKFTTEVIDEFLIIRCPKCFGKLTHNKLSFLPNGIWCLHCGSSIEQELEEK